MIFNNRIKKNLIFRVLKMQLMKMRLSDWNAGKTFALTEQRRRLLEYGVTVRVGAVRPAYPQ